MSDYYITDRHNTNDLVRLAKCPECGKTFVIPPQSVYKLDTKEGRRYYCSYTCHQKVKKSLETKADIEEREKIKRELEGR